jgi:hypothetical protein
MAILHRESIRTVYGSNQSPPLREALEKGWVRRTLGSFFEVTPGAKP